MRRAPEGRFRAAPLGILLLWIRALDVVEPEDGVVFVDERAELVPGEGGRVPDNGARLVALGEILGIVQAEANLPGGPPDHVPIPASEPVGPRLQVPCDLEHSGARAQERERMKSQPMQESR